jgi:N-acetylglucosamine kinase-like BadF-type ATPase
VTQGRAAVLAIDGGNSKTDVALVAGDGALLAAVRGPGSNAHIIGLDRAMSIIAELAAAAARQAGLAAGGAPVAEHVSACLAGADLAEDEERLGAALHAQRHALTCTVVNDTFAILRAGLQPAGGQPAGGQPAGGQPAGGQPARAVPGSGTGAWP